MDLTFAPLVVLLATVKKLVDFLRYARAGDTNAILTQLVTWVGGVLMTMLVAHTAWAHTLTVGGLVLGKLNLWSQILVGVGIGSTGSLAFDTLKSVDRHQSAALPPLVPAVTHPVGPDGQPQ